MDSEAAIEQGEAQGTDLSFADPREEQEQFMRVATRPKQGSAAEQVQKQPAPTTVANADPDDSSTSQTVERIASEATTVKDLGAEGEQTQPIDELADANTRDADNSEDSSIVSTNPVAVEPVNPTSETSDQIVSTIDSAPKYVADSDQTTPKEAPSLNTVQDDPAGLLPSVADEPVSPIAASSSTSELGSQTARTKTLEPNDPSVDEQQVRDAIQSSASVAIASDIEPTESPDSAPAKDDDVDESPDTDKEEAEVSPVLSPKPTTVQTEQSELEDSTDPKDDQAEQSDNADEESVEDLAISPPNDVEAAEQFRTQTDAREDSQDDELANEASNELTSDAQTALPGVLSANAISNPAEQPAASSEQSAPTEDTNSTDKSDDRDDLLPDLDDEQPPSTDAPQPKIATSQSDASPIAEKATDDNAVSKSPADKPKQKARLGVYMTGNPNDSIVRMLDPKSSADNAGIRVGDRIVQIGMTKVSEFKNVNDAIGKLKANDIVRIWFQRNGALFVVDTRMKGGDTSPTMTPTMPQPEDDS